MKLSSVYIGILPLLLHGGLAKALVKEGDGISGKIAARFRQFFENPDAQGLQNDYTQPYGYETSTTATLALTVPDPSDVGYPGSSRADPATRGYGQSSESASTPSARPGNGGTSPNSESSSLTTDIESDSDHYSSATSSLPDTPSTQSNAVPTSSFFFATSAALPVQGTPESSSQSSTPNATATPIPSSSSPGTLTEVPSLPPATITSALNVTSSLPSTGILSNTTTALAVSANISTSPTIVNSTLVPSAASNSSSLLILPTGNTTLIPSFNISTTTLPLPSNFTSIPQTNGTSALNHTAILPTSTSNSSTIPVACTGGEMSGPCAATGPTRTLPAVNTTRPTAPTNSTGSTILNTSSWLPSNSTIMSPSPSRNLSSSLPICTGGSMVGPCMTSTISPIPGIPVSPLPPPNSTNVTQPLTGTSGFPVSGGVGLCTSGSMVGPCFKPTSSFNSTTPSQVVSNHTSPVGTGSLCLVGSMLSPCTASGAKPIPGSPASATRFPSNSSALAISSPTPSSPCATGNMTGPCVAPSSTRIPGVPTSIPLPLTNSSATTAQLTGVRGPICIVGSMTGPCSASGTGAIASTLPLNSTIAPSNTTSAVPTTLPICIEGAMSGPCSTPANITVPTANSSTIQPVITFNSSLLSIIPPGTAYTPSKGLTSISPVSTSGSGGYPSPKTTSSICHESKTTTKSRYGYPLTTCNESRPYATHETPSTIESLMTDWGSVTRWTSTITPPSNYTPSTFLTQIVSGVINSEESTGEAQSEKPSIIPMSSSPMNAGLGPMDHRHNHTGTNDLSMLRKISRDGTVLLTKWARGLGQWFGAPPLQGNDVRVVEPDGPAD
ncbi:uncharacterized protein E0L32_005418 [Thyridium curvatum]|uniref:Uncharacterized protein n=1 Tax=Thyridium curvatum TaxID=1093900 RepID=A0A507B729_9PEZI|nr:uncharacterized protein E0L32_005418 [Thyridium curvatum]TPX14454.1 hypothetical protein E0L32_005418 [Thyridium curvatum]